MSALDTGDEELRKIAQQALHGESDEERQFAATLLAVRILKALKTIDPGEPTLRLVPPEEST
jgi:hypothetical protein